ncbi:hypothetical protein [Weissella hellenica]|uniref:hypothetical protein n=1 Tax=Weissella hellenica TaxID=46256 RepID=UPI003884E91B
MKNKAYIVVNEQQEHEVLEQLEREGYVWRGLNTKPTEQPRLIDEPITIFARDDKRLTFDYKVNEAYFADFEIDFDGRKEEKMSEKYVVSQEFMEELKEWKDTLTSNDDEYKPLVSLVNIKNLPETVYMWLGDDVPDKENNNRLIAIIRWVNGEDVFEVEKPKKWVVRSKDSSKAGRNLYVVLDVGHGIKTSINYWGKSNATKFDTKEEAESWANSHQEVVEVVDV